MNGSAAQCLSGELTANRERVAVLDAGAQYGKVCKHSSLPSHEY